jgi:hypothetical protein
MENRVNLDAAYGPSEDIVAREIEGEIVIVPLVAGIGDMEDELYTLNETGRDIWKRLDGRTPLREVVRELAEEYEAPDRVLEEDVVGLLGELLERRMIARAEG